MQERTDTGIPGSIYKCPVCSEYLEAEGKSYRCINRHCYDISADGYVNLLPVNMKHSRDPGDTKETTEARRNFLNTGHFSPLSEKLTSLIINYVKENSTRPCVVLDAGCGEGYYLHMISRDTLIKNSCLLYGTDISKHGIKKASRRNRDIHFSVGNIYSLPVADKTVNILVNVFAPFNEHEFSRVLADNGIIISVTPGSLHLEGLKKILYENQHFHDENISTSGKLGQNHMEKLSYEIFINNNEAISNLLRMTPYLYKTSREKIDSVLENIKELTTKAEFIIRVFKVL